MKTINSEKKFDTEHFKVKIGTLNKKCPATMYLEAGTYITANDEKESYKSDIIAIALWHQVLNSKRSHTRHLQRTLFTITLGNHIGSVLAKQTFLSKQTIQPEFLLVTDVAIGQIRADKSTHYTIQLHFKPSKSQIDTKKTFKQLYKEYLDEYSETFPMYYDILDKHGFICNKTK